MAVERAAPGGHSLTLLVVRVNGWTLALPVPIVQRVFRAVEIMSLPHAPDVVRGIINVQGRILPVFDIRRRFALPEREMSIHDHLVVADTGRRMVALLVDSVSGVFEYSDDLVSPADEVLPGLPYIDGVVKLGSEMILVHDLHTFLSAGEEIALARSLESRATGRA